MTLSKEVNLGHVVSWVTLTVALLASWSVFYSEQKINSVKLQSQSEVIKTHTRAINNLTENQTKMISTISNNKVNIQEVKTELRDMNNTIKESREYLIRIAGKVGAYDKEDK